MARPLAKLISLLTPERRWAQFSLGTMFVVVTVLCVLCAWLAVKVNRAHRQRDAVDAIRRLGGYAAYEPAGPSWLRELLGDDFFAHVVEAGTDLGIRADFDREGKASCGS